MYKFLSGICIVLAITIILFSGLRVFATATENEKTINILFTHDLHDHFLPNNIEQNGKIVQSGGYARLQSAINIEKEKNPDSLLIDGGDYSMGTLFQSIYSTDAPELITMGQLGYDVTTFGNHEYDFRDEGLADSLNNARKNGSKLPQIVQSNGSFPTDENGYLTQSLTDLKQAMNDYGVKDYTVIERNGVKIGIFGLMGKDAATCSPKSEIKFTDAIKNAKRVVNILKQEEGVDLIICLSHSGISIDKSKSEDEKLAKNVPEINIIISGHTHSILENPIVIGQTIIGASGENGKNLGVINITQDSKKGWKLNNYNLKQIDNTLPDNPNIAQLTANFKKTVQLKYLNNFNLKFDEVLANSSFNFAQTVDIGKKHDEDTLGNLITDAYIYAVKKAEGTNYEPIAMSLVPFGTIRGSFVKGAITVEDVFTSSSLGIGKDKTSGYPLISVYLTGKELNTICEIDASISPSIPAMQLYMANTNFTFNPNRLILNNITNTSIQKTDGTFEEIYDKKLYRVVSGLYSAQMLSIVGEKSYGILSIVPKTKEGKPITDLEEQIITDNISGHKNEIKEWFAIAEYLKSFDKVNGIPQIPQYYNSTHKRKVVDNDHAILALVSNPNKFGFLVYSIVILIISIIGFAIRKFVTQKKRKHSRCKVNTY